MNRRISLRSLLLVPLVLQLGATAVVISLVNYQGRQLAASSLAASSQQRASRQVSEYLTTYLRGPQQVIRLMAQAVESGDLDPGDRAAITRHLWNLHRIFPDAPYLNFGWANGDFIGLGQVSNTDRRPYLEVAQAASIDRLEQIRLDPHGRPSGLQRINPFGDFRGDGWYRDPVQAGRAVWTPIYNWVDAPEVMAMGAGMPIRRGGVLVGVAGVDVFLANISHFLAGLPISEGGEVYIVEGDGRLVADTSGRLPFSIINGRGVRHRAQDAGNPVIRDTARALVRGHGGFTALDHPQQMTLPLPSGDALVRVDPYRDGQGLDWRIVVVIPEADVYGNLRQEAISHLVVSLVAIVISGAIALFVVEFVIRRLDRLVISTDAMAEGQLSQNVELGSIQEMARLATSFNTMAERLRNSFSTLRSTNRESLRLAQQRSEELLKREQQLELEARQRRRLEQTLQQVSQVAREPLLADPLTGLLSRRGLERRLASALPRGPQQQVTEPPQPELLLQLRIAPPPPVALTPEVLEQIASALEQLSAEHHGLAAHGGGGRFSLLLAGLRGEAAPALLEALAEQLQPLLVVAGITVLPVEADGPARLSALAAADQALAEACDAVAPWRFAGPAV